MAENGLVGDPESLFCMWGDCLLRHNSFSLGLGPSLVSLGFNTSTPILLASREEVEGYWAPTTICLCFCSTGSWVNSTKSGLHVCARNLNSGPHVCTGKHLTCRAFFSQPCLKQYLLTIFSLLPSSGWAGPYFSRRISELADRKANVPGERLSAIWTYVRHWGPQKQYKLCLLVELDVA